MKQLLTILLCVCFSVSYGQGRDTVTTNPKNLVYYKSVSAFGTELIIPFDTVGQPYWSKKGAIALKGGLLWYNNGTAWLSPSGAGISLTTSGTSGPATLIGTTLNIPQYAGQSVDTARIYDSLAVHWEDILELYGFVDALNTEVADKQDQLNGTGFVKVTGTTISYDNSTYLTTAVTSVGLTAGTGVSIAGSSPITSTGVFTVTNTAPDQTVSITSGTGISATGTYPNFTITNTSPSSGGTVTSVGVVAGTGVSIAGSSPITGAGTYTVTNSAPDQTVTLGAGSGISIGGSYPAFTVTATNSGTVTSVSGTSGNITSTGGANPVINLATSGTAGTTGGASAIPVITTDAYGRVTTITTVAPATAGTVTTVSVVSANGFAGTVANPTTTPAITLTTTVNALVKGNGTALVAATAGTDYQSPSLTNGYIWVGNASNVATGTPMSGAATMSATGVVTLSSTGVSAGSYGSSTAIPTFTVGVDGRLTSVGTATISSGGGSGSVTSVSAGADITITGTASVNPTVAVSAVTTYTITETTQFTYDGNNGGIQVITMANANDTMTLSNITEGRLFPYELIVKRSTTSAVLRWATTVKLAMGAGYGGQPPQSTPTTAIDRYFISKRQGIIYVEAAIDYE